MELSPCKYGQIAPTFPDLPTRARKRGREREDEIETERARERERESKKRNLGEGVLWIGTGS